MTLWDMREEGEKVIDHCARGEVNDGFRQVLVEGGGYELNCLE
jgi:hypothetical protein